MLGNQLKFNDLFFGFVLLLLSGKLIDRHRQQVEHHMLMTYSHMLSKNK